MCLYPLARCIRLCNFATALSGLSFVYATMNWVKLLSFGSLALIAVCLALVSVVDFLQPPAAEAPSRYTSLPMLLLWGVMAVAATFFLWRVRRKLRGPVLLLHFSFLVMLAGALTTHLFSENGKMELLLSAKPSDAFLRADGTVGHLPFAVQLTHCETQHHADGDAPKNFIASLLVIEPDGQPLVATVAPNRLLSHCHWRFCLQTLSPERCRLSLRHDPWGLGITYFGYALLFFALLLPLLHREKMLRLLLMPLLCVGGGFAFILLIRFFEWDTLALYNGFVAPEMVKSTCFAGSFLLLCNAFLIDRRNTLNRALQVCGFALLLLVALWCVGLLALRGSLSGYAPFAGGFDAMLLLALCGALLTLQLRTLHRLFPSLGLFLVALSLWTASPDGSLPLPRPVAPILASPLLSLHVVTIIAAYALLALLSLLSAAALLALYLEKLGKVSALSAMALCRFAQRLLRPALLLLTAGIFIGAVWGSKAWGSYWSWDPKETWALITLLVYALPLHRTALPLFSRPRAFCLYAWLAFAAVLMTYFGVNHLLGGMHSYA